MSTDTLAEVDPLYVKRAIENREVLVVDVRETDEYEDEHIPGALLLPLSFMEAVLFPNIEVKQIIVVCKIGERSAAAAKQLVKEGVKNVVSMRGGINAWAEAGLDLEGVKHE